MLSEETPYHRAIRVCALLCLGLLLLASFCAPIHKHDNGGEASCLFCHATTRTEWLSHPFNTGRPVASIAFTVAKPTGVAMAIDAECLVRIPRAPPALLLSL
jgi:hypothetical protein